MKRRRLGSLLLSGLLALAGFMVLQFLIGAALFKWREQSLPTLSPTESWFATAAIQVQDLPSGWRWGDVLVENVPPAEGRVFCFFGTADRTVSWINVSETLLLFPDVTSAQAGYQTQRDTYFPPAAEHWQIRSELSMTHQADEWHVACLPTNLNGELVQACGVAARYDRVVIILLGNVFEERWLTMADFRAVMEAMDQRIIAALNELP